MLTWQRRYKAARSTLDGIKGRTDRHPLQRASWSIRGAVRLLHAGCECGKSPDSTQPIASRDAVVKDLGNICRAQDTNPSSTRARRLEAERAGPRGRHAGTAKEFSPTTRRQISRRSARAPSAGHASSRHRNIPLFQRPQNAGMLILRCCAARHPHARIRHRHDRHPRGFRGTANHPRRRCAAHINSCQPDHSARTLSEAAVDKVRSRASRSWRSLPTAQRGVRGRKGPIDYEPLPLCRHRGTPSRLARRS